MIKTKIYKKIVFLACLFLLNIPILASGKEDFQLTMLDVHQGLSVLIEADGHRMLYDGGGRNRSSYVVSYLKSHGVDELDYIIVSHYDEDHLSGMVGVMNTIDVDTAITPDYEADSKIYQSFRTQLESHNITEEHPTVGSEYTLGDAGIEILGPEYYDVSEENNSSIVVKVRYGDFSCILTGDAEQEEEKEIISSGSDLTTDLYVVGHHGSASSSSGAFLDAMSPQYAFISVGADNSYGHPTQSTLDALAQREIEVYRTDLQGEVTLSSDGENSWISESPISPSESGPTAGEEIEESGSNAVSETADYIINKNTGKFHYPDCRSVKQMKEKNKIYIHDSREACTSEGYEPCANCNP